jgi:hypothetical protein
MVLPNWLVILLIFAIVLLDLTIHKKQLGIVILHDNDHTLNKFVQYLTAFFERQESYFTILVLKVKNKKSKAKDTGTLFNIGYRQSNKADYYLFLDSGHCQLDNYFNLLVAPPQYQFPAPGTVQIMPEICGVLVSREYFKEFDGFSNTTTATFPDFLRILKKNKKNKHAHGGYAATNANVQYHIVEKTQITPHALRVIIAF